MEKPDNGGNGPASGKGKTNARASRLARCTAVGDAIDTSRSFANFMSLLIGDIVCGRIDPKTANAACNAGGKLLKVVEMEHKFGKAEAHSGKTLQLT